jgi:uncharacterized Fe-S cluster protein YjdI
MERQITKRYTKDSVTVVWKPHICIHSGICASELLEVFDPLKRPWINMEGATNDRIIQQVKRCPSGALSLEINENK